MHAKIRIPNTDTLHVIIESQDNGSFEVRTDYRTDYGQLDGQYRLLCIIHGGIDGAWKCAQRIMEYSAQKSK